MTKLRIFFLFSFQQKTDLMSKIQFAEEMTEKQQKTDTILKKTNFEIIDRIFKNEKNFRRENRNLN